MLITRQFEIDVSKLGRSLEETTLLKQSIAALSQYLKVRAQIFYMRSVNGQGKTKELYHNLWLDSTLVITKTDCWTEAIKGLHSEAKKNEK